MSPARQAAVEGEAAIDQAELADRQALADHARGKLKRKPKPTVLKAREALAAAQTTAAALEQAVVDAQAELETAIEEHREEYAPKLDHQSEQGRERSRKVATKLAELEAARARVRALRRWLDGGRYSPGKSPAAVTDLRRPSGEPYTLSDLLPLIERALAPPVEQPKPEPRPLLRVTR